MICRMAKFSDTCVVGVVREKYIYAHHLLKNCSYLNVELMSYPTLTCVV